MEPDPNRKPAPVAPRKMKFMPKPPKQRLQKSVLPKLEKVEDAETDDAKAEELMRLFNEASARGRPKVEKKSQQARVTFGYGDRSSMRSYGTPMGSHSIKKDHLSEGSDSSRGIKDYKEPWDYYSYYPVTLPLRRPYSGNPEQLDQEEFREGSESMNYNEDSINSAAELGLTLCNSSYFLSEENLDSHLLFIQLPATLPIPKESADKESNENIASSSKPGSSVKPCRLAELPAGFMGKMLVYKSGAVKLKLGDTLYNVLAGLNCQFAQDVAAINTQEKHCCVVGELNKRAVITLDLDSVIDNMMDL